MITTLIRPGHVPDSGLVIADARQLEVLLRERRVERGLSIISTAEAAGLSKNAVSDLESPRVKSKLLTASKYAAAVDLRLAVRLLDDGQPARRPWKGATPAGVHPVMALLMYRRRSLHLSQGWLGTQIHRSLGAVSRRERGTQQSLLDDTILYAAAVQACLVVRVTLPEGGTR